MGRTRSFIFYLLVAAGCGEGAHTSVGSNQSALLWHAGVFRYLPSQSADLETFVSGLSHPTSGYGKVSSIRAGNFNTFVAVLLQAIDDSNSDGPSMRLMS